MTAATNTRLDPNVAPARAPSHQPPSTSTKGAKAPSRKPTAPRTRVKKAQLVRYPTLGRNRTVRAPDSQKKAPSTAPGHHEFVVWFDRVAVKKQAANKESSSLQGFVALVVSVIGVIVRVKARKSLRSYVPQAAQRGAKASAHLLALGQSKDAPTTSGRMDRTKVFPAQQPRHLERMSCREMTQSVSLAL